MNNFRDNRQTTTSRKTAVLFVCTDFVHGTDRMYVNTLHIEKEAAP
ncbi:MAG: hypothetical protein JW804_01145 [Sedimentisphaerales bacterium]|nr:hypothetical protein [Sedimentisphaerales bacterium]